MTLPVDLQKGSPNIISLSNDNDVFALQLLPVLR
jgi:hypothetical protein